MSFLDSLLTILIEDVGMTLYVFVKIGADVAVIERDIAGQISSGKELVERRMIRQAARCGQKLTGKFVKVSAVNDLNDAANAVPEI